MKIAMTGASGNMGREALRQTLELETVEKVRILLTRKKKNDTYAKQLKKRYGGRIEVVRGSIEEEGVCDSLIQGADYVIHMAAVIPPKSDADPEAADRCNRLGTMALVDAIKRLDPQPKFIHISTVALYGNRNEKHPFGRVGDPLLVSPFDWYAMQKLKGERYVLDADLTSWAVIRQTAMLHPNMMHDNVSDGLMFHTALNAPLEWVSDRDSGYLIKRILERDSAGEVDGFWKKIYNLAAGPKGRDTGYDTFKDGFAIIGGSPEKYFRPDFFATRNFHGVWYADGDELESLFHYQRDGVTEYWKEIGKRHKIYALGRLVPAKLVYLCLFKKLLDHPNSPVRWAKDKDAARTFATFGKAGREGIPKKWEEVKLLSRGDFGDYDALRDADRAKAEGRLLSHGYDESIPVSEWNLALVREAAAFRGGKCLSDTMTLGDPYQKLKWQCCEGHVFEASPYTVLRGGHWCPQCMPEPWRFGILAKKMPFYAQVWYDSHDEDETQSYSHDENGTACMTEETP